ncbi:hypothetical protein Cob_v010693 [Colletotrichum orbiculare MAFF 240422]|uniref:Uncharacterized protein n=1 Tax=Colletotrichum orbiculare (strain 104-T / ATCC 96160 / CBS 514.97 / LARS 414 / MAFF 240422) TaxID=1213857 RepID=N4V8Z9_COLOR|nr:hypothetical protein Cob_v010693 [Colletotrichum orbiculare MAFF 240422]
MPPPPLPPPPLAKDAPRRREDDFTFVQITHPSDVATWKKKVRSHAARNPSARRQRVADFQDSQRRGEADANVASDAVVRSRRTGRRNLPFTPNGSNIMLFGPLTLLSASDLDPFDSFIRPLSPFEMHLMYHFKVAVVLSNIACIPDMDVRIPEKGGPVFWRSISNHWLRTAVSDIGMLASVFLLACRHVYKRNSVAYPEIYHQHAEAYRTQCMWSLADTLKTELKTKHISDDTITKTLALASDASLMNRKEDNEAHLRSAGELIKLRQNSSKGVRDDPDSSGRLVILFSDSDKSEHPLATVQFGNLYGEKTGTTLTPVAKMPNFRHLVFSVGGGS